MTGTSYFTELLYDFARYSAKIDRCTINKKDLEALEQERDRITGQDSIIYTLNERQLLRRAAEHLIDEAKRVMELNRQVKAICREIEKARRAERRNAEKEVKTA